MALERHGVLSFSAPGAAAPVPTAYREPGYPALIAVAWRFTGGAPAALGEAIVQLPSNAAVWRPVVALNLSLLLLSAVAVGVGVGKLAGPARGALAFALVACSPALAANVPKAMSENLAAAHWSLAALCILALARRERGARLATIFVVGLLPLSRAEGALLLPLALLVDVLAGAGRPARERLRAAALLTLGLALPSALWMTRNLGLLGHPVLSDRSGLALSVRAALDADIDQFGLRSALLAWTPLDVSLRLDRRSSPEPTWLEFRPVDGSNYYFRTVRRWQETRRSQADSLAVDGEFRRAALRRFASHPWDHVRAGAAVAWRGLFAESSPDWARPLDLRSLLGLALAAALTFATATALARRSLAVVALLAPAWTGFAFHVAATEFLPRYSVPFLPLAWAAVALAFAHRTAASAADSGT
jgi:hypothetical protein